MGKITLVLPIYNEAAILQEVLIKYLADLKSLGMPYEIIAVNDGSTDGTESILLTQSKLNRSLRIVNLTGRWGKQAAITAGMDAADPKSAAIILADVDLGNPVGIIKRIVDEFKRGEKIVYARREKMGLDNFRTRISTAVVKRAARFFGVDGQYTGKAHIALYARAVADVIISLPDRNKFLRAMDNWIGWRIKYIDYIATYTKPEHKNKVQTSTQRAAKTGVKIRKRDRLREHTASQDLFIGFLIVSVLMLGLGIVVALRLFNTEFWMHFVVWAGFLFSVLLSFIFLSRAVLIKRTGILHNTKTAKIYEVKNVVN